MKSLSKIAPYNRCDYRCESCVHIRDCRLFNKGIGEQLNSAQNPDDIDPVLTNIHKTIFETIRMLQEKANELGMNLAKTEEDDLKDEIDLENIPLYRMGHDFSLTSFQFLQKLAKIKLPQKKLQQLKPDFEDLGWYHTIVSTKIARALASQADGDEFGLEDAQNSVSVALSAVNICQMALENFRDNLPDLKADLDSLLQMIRKLDTKIREQFNDLIDRVD